MIKVTTFEEKFLRILFYKESFVYITRLSLGGWGITQNDTRDCCGEFRR